MVEAGVDDGVGMTPESRDGSTLGKSMSGPTTKRSRKSNDPERQKKDDYQGPHLGVKRRRTIEPRSSSNGWQVDYGLKDETDYPSRRTSDGPVKVTELPRVGCVRGHPEYPVYAYVYTNGHINFRVCKTDAEKLRQDGFQSVNKRYAVAYANVVFDSTLPIPKGHKSPADVRPHVLKYLQDNGFVDLSNLDPSPQGSVASVAADASPRSHKEMEPSKAKSGTESIHELHKRTMHTAHVLDVLNDDLDTANREIARLRQIVAGNARNTVEAVRTAVCSSRTQTEDALRLFDHRLEAFALKVAARASDGYASIQEQEATDLRLHFTRMLTLFAVRAQDPVTGGIDSTGLPEAAPIPSTKDTSEIEQINKQNAEHEHRVVILKDEWEKENCRQKEIVQKLKQEIDVLKNPKSPSPQSKHTAPSDTRNVQHASASQSSLEPTEKRIVAGVEYSRMRANHRHSQWWTSAPKISTLGGETFLEYAFHVDLNPDLGIVDESAFKVNPTTGLPAFHHVASGRKAGGWISTPELVPCTTSNSEYARRVQWAILTPIADFNI